MIIRAIAFAAAASVVPFAASAVTAPVLENIVDGGTTSIENGGFYSFEYKETDSSNGSQEYLYQFVAAESLGAVTGVSLNPIPSGGITGLFVRWLAADQTTVVAEWDGDMAAPFTTGFAAGQTQYLSIGWDSTVQGGDVDVNIQAVPVPAGALLLGTALIGGLALRRKA